MCTALLSILLATLMAGKERTDRTIRGMRGRSPPGWSSRSPRPDRAGRGSRSRIMVSGEADPGTASHAFFERAWKRVLDQLVAACRD